MHKNYQKGANSGFRPWWALAMLLLLWWPEAKVFAVEGAAELYQSHCASCHGADRLGRMGPALLPENLGRLPRKEAVDVISSGRRATQMPGFSDRLSSDEIDALAAFVFTPLPEVPGWGMEQIRASHIVHHPLASLPEKPVFTADMMNLFVVVELGDHHATILDGDKLKPIHRFATRFALHGGPKFSHDGRFVYFGSRDGWISKYDIYSLQVVAEIRAGINTRNVAVSADDRYVIVANYLPHTLTVLDAKELEPLGVIPAVNSEGKTSRVSAVYTAPPRQSFIAALKDIPEVWEIGYGASSTASGVASQNPSAPLLVRRIMVEDYLDDFFFDADYSNLLGATRGSGDKGQVIDLNKGDKVANLDLSGMPHLGSGITWDYRGRAVMATPNLAESEISIIDLTSWETIKRIPTPGPGFFMRSHKDSPYLWADVFFGPNSDAMLIIDKNTLEIVKTLRPAPGKTSAHVEFDRYGRYALVSIWDDDGALVIYDANTLEEIKRIPMAKPSGKYNVYNKTHYAEGTSH